MQVQKPNYKVILRHSGEDSLHECCHTEEISYESFLRIYYEGLESFPKKTFSCDECGTTHNSWDVEFKHQKPIERILSNNALKMAHKDFVDSFLNSTSGRPLSSFAYVPYLPPVKDLSSELIEDTAKQIKTEMIGPLKTIQPKFLNIK